MAVTLDYQFELNGVKIGDGTIYPVIEIDGIHTLPADFNWGIKAGKFGGRVLNFSAFNGRTFVIDTIVTDQGSGYHSNLSALKAAWNPVKPGVLALRIPGIGPSGGNVIADCVCDVSVKTDFQASLGFGEVRIKVQTLWPFFEDETETVFVSSGDANQNVTNTGTAPARWAAHLKTAGGSSANFTYNGYCRLNHSSTDFDVYVNTTIGKDNIQFDQRHCKVFTWYSAFTGFIDDPYDSVSGYQTISGGLQKFEPMAVGLNQFTWNGTGLTNGTTGLFNVRYRRGWV